MYFPTAWTCYLAGIALNCKFYCKLQMQKLIFLQSTLFHFKCLTCCILSRRSNILVLFCIFLRTLFTSPSFRPVLFIRPTCHKYIRLNLFLTTYSSGPICRIVFTVMANFKLPIRPDQLSRPNLHILSPCRQDLSMFWPNFHTAFPAWQSCFTFLVYSFQLFHKKYFTSVLLKYHPLLFHLLFLVRYPLYPVFKTI